MKHLVLIVVLLVTANFLPAQTYYYYSRTEYTYGPYYFAESLNFIDKLIQSKEDREKAAAEKKRMEKQTTDMRSYYGSFDTYPANIEDGWHSVVILGGDEFIGDRKVQVENGRIKRMVWDNWMEEELTFSGPIIKAMAGIRIKGGTGPLGGMVDVYFMNSLGENPVKADPPLVPGTVTFWTSQSDKDKGKIYIVFEDALLGPFTEHQDWDKAPACGDKQQINVVYKPGLYKFKVMRRAYSLGIGRTLMEGKVELTNGGCELVEVYEKKKKRKGPKQ